MVTRISSRTRSPTLPPSRDTGYVPIIDDNGVNIGYTITGFGKDATVGPNNDGTIILLTSGQ